MVIPNETARAMLEKQKLELEELQEMSEESRDTVTLDQQTVGRLSRMDAMQMQAMAQATERQRKLQLEKIESALKRIDENEYGYCSNCGEEIEEKRLQIDPATLLCINCAQKTG